jgi:hypothetical protein
MDLRAYYQKIRKIEAGITDPEVVIVSRETPEGGKAGARTEVPRALAARLVAEDKADLATPEDAAQFRSENQAKWKAAQQAVSLTEGEVRALRSSLKPKRKT